ncbi:C40 family peptidase [Tumidithrix helvetica PCC 7403]|uniref:C40 family peptidase n=1 Tax=Tumidithrix helvetica TaxID=3457545 RepID=UPI003CAF2F80
MAMQHRSITDINIYDSPQLERLATQMAAGRYLVFREPEIQDGSQSPDRSPKQIALLEDGYEGFIRNEDLTNLQAIAGAGYIPQFLTPTEIAARIDDAIDYMQGAMQHPNQYLWGGTVPPDFDCSGLMQAAFVSVGIWLPRDAYQQEAFLEPIALENLQRGDFIFFGNPTKATHVGMHLGKGEYIHSSGQEHGHHGIAISSLSGSDRVSQWYAAQLRGAGRVTQCYSPKFC